MTVRGGVYRGSSSLILSCVTQVGDKKINKEMVAVMGWRMHEQEWRKGPWTPEEDNLLTEYVRMYGEGRWSSVAGVSGLKRSGKSCRLRWVNYLRPGLKKGQLTPQEEGIIIELHALWGNKWSTIARYLPGRTDNEIKNYWRTNFKKKGIPSKNQEKQKHKATFTGDQHHHQQKPIMNNYVLSHVEENNQGKMFESPKLKMEDISVSMQNYNQSVMAQDVASWWNTVSDDGLWSGFLWNQDNYQLPNEFVIEQSFSSYF